VKNSVKNGQSTQTKPRFIDLDGQQIFVSEDVYRAYKRPVWAERKHQERWSRCRKPDGSRCDENCSRCPLQRSGSMLSLEQSRENGYEPADVSADVEAIVFSRLLLEQLMRHLDELDSDSRRLCRLIGEGTSEREIAAVTGISQSTLNYRKNRLFVKLRNLLKDST
jgi:DNA-directed RNA polymerase specialized sigma24 family protein